MSDILGKKIRETVEAIKENRAPANITFSAKSHLVDKLLTNVTVRKFNFNSDEPKELGGTDIAPNPVEFVLASLAACQEIALSAFAAYLGLKLESVNIKVNGSLDLRGFFAIDDGVAPGFESIEYETEIISNEPKEKIEQLVAIVESHCPVLDTLQRPVKITGRVNIKQSAAAA